MCMTQEVINITKINKDKTIIIVLQVTKWIRTKYRFL